MQGQNDLVQEYLSYCECQKRLDKKTLKAYRIDLRQFEETVRDEFSDSVVSISAKGLGIVFGIWHKAYKPKTVKRKIASIKAFYRWLEETGAITENPFLKVHTQFREPKALPKTIPEHVLERFLQEIYNAYETAGNDLAKSHALRDIAVIETLFGTGVRISELCGLSALDINLVEGELLIHGKGQKERIIQIPDEHLRHLLQKYYETNKENISTHGYFFVNNCGRPLNDQSVRNMIKKYAGRAGIMQHITPHMFRHTFATLLLDANVNLRCIQELLGHSSVSTTEIYTHVSAAKQRQVLTEHHPRKLLNVEGGKL